MTGVTIIRGMNGIANSMDSAAPTDAPDDRPKMYGEANGFLNTACIAVPAMARPAPTNAPMTTLGALISLTIMLDPQEPLPNIDSHTSVNEYDLSEDTHERSR